MGLGVCISMMGLFVLGIFTFSRWLMVGAIFQTIIMVGLAVCIIKRRYNERSLEPSENKLFYAVIFLPAVLLIGMIYYIPECVWINIAVLLVLAAAHVYFAYSATDNPSVRIKYIRDTLYIVFFIAIILIKDNAPFFIGEL